MMNYSFKDNRQNNNYNSNPLIYRSQSQNGSHSLVPSDR